MGHSVGFVAFDGMTAYDLVGAYTAVTRLPDHSSIDLDWRIVGRSTVAHSAAGLTIQCRNVETLGEFDVVVVPGGPATRELRETEPFLEWLQTAADAPRITSACTGSLLLGAAGFLTGRRATTHPNAMDLLEPYCDTVVEDRVVVADDIVTARGVTASLDLGLWLCQDLGDETAVEGVRDHLDYPYNPN